MPAQAFSVEVIYQRAETWHAQHTGRGCDCREAGYYPCSACRAEILELVALLDSVVRDTIRVVTLALDRL